ncbi:MAG: hypothetical protein U5L72_15030 [Bacteroidales bacterium]|nr:hypothetical protein [Bacteroidales bacterium]
MKNTLSPAFESFYDKIKDILESARNRSYRAANFDGAGILGNWTHNSGRRTGRQGSGRIWEATFSKFIP